MIDIKKAKTYNYWPAAHYGKIRAPCGAIRENSVIVCSEFDWLKCRLIPYNNREISCLLDKQINWHFLRTSFSTESCKSK